MKVPLTNPNFVLTPSVKAISRFTGPTLVEFGITSEVGPYSSSVLFIFHKGGIQREDNIDGWVFPMFHCLVSANTVKIEWAFSPCRPDYAEGKR